MKLLRRLTALSILALPLAGCSGTPLRHFAGKSPAFDPLRFWTGHTHSWGVVENRAGEPTETVETDCIGTPDGPDSLSLQQTLTFGDGTVQHRQWHLRRVAPHHFDATANDMIGTAHGQSAGPAFHWQWTLATHPGNPLLDISMEQWMYRLPDGTMMNRTIVRKLGIVLAEVTEHFEPVPR